MFSSIGKTLQRFQNKFSNRNHLRSTFTVLCILDIQVKKKYTHEASIKVNNIPICLLQVGGSYRCSYRVLFDNCKARRTMLLSFIKSLAVWSHAGDKAVWNLPSWKLDIRYYYSLLNLMSREMINVKSLKTVPRNEISWTPRRDERK